VKKLLKAVRSLSGNLLWLQYQGKDDQSEWRVVELSKLLPKDIYKNANSWDVIDGYLVSDGGYVIEPSLLYSLSNTSSPTVYFTISKEPFVLANLADPYIKKANEKDIEFIHRQILNHAEQILSKDTWQLYIKKIDVTIFGLSEMEKPNGWLIISSILEGEWTA